jgi:hypothetical protein
MSGFPRPACDRQRLSRSAEELLQSIMDEFAAARQTHEALEAKALFRLLNYCPPTSQDELRLPTSQDQIIE